MYEGIDINSLYAESTSLQDKTCQSMPEHAEGLYYTLNPHIFIAVHFVIKGNLRH